MKDAKILEFTGEPPYFKQAETALKKLIEAEKELQRATVKADMALAKAKTTLRPLIDKAKKEGDRYERLKTKLEDTITGSNSNLKTQQLGFDRKGNKMNLQQQMNYHARQYHRMKRMLALDAAPSYLQSLRKYAEELSRVATKIHQMPDKLDYYDSLYSKAAPLLKKYKEDYKAMSPEERKALPESPASVAFSLSAYYTGIGRKEAIMTRKQAANASKGLKNLQAVVSKADPLITELKKITSQEVPKVNLSDPKAVAAAKKRVESVQNKLHALLNKARTYGKVEGASSIYDPMLNRMKAAGLFNSYFIRPGKYD